MLLYHNVLSVVGRREERERERGCVYYAGEWRVHTVYYSVVRILYTHIQHSTVYMHVHDVEVFYCCDVMMI